MTRELFLGNLEEIKIRMELVADGEHGHDEVYDSQDDVPRLVAAVEAVLDLHRGPNYCGRCSGGASLLVAWPCLEVRAITAALEAS